MKEPKPDLAAVLEHYGARTYHRGRYMTSCVFHEDSTPSLSVNTERQLWNCQSCGQGGDSIRLIQLKEETDFRGALEVAAALGFPAGDGGDGGEQLSGSSWGRRKVARRKGDRQGNRWRLPTRGSD